MIIDVDEIYQYAIYLLVSQKDGFIYINTNQSD